MLKKVEVNWARLGSNESIFNPKTWGLRHTLEGRIATELCIERLTDSVNRLLSFTYRKDIRWVAYPTLKLDMVIGVPEEVGIEELNSLFADRFRKVRAGLWSYWAENYKAFGSEEFAEGEEG